MKFLCLVHVDRDLEVTLTPAEQAAFAEDNKAYGEWLERGPGIVFGALAAPQAATLIRNRRGELSMTDGPYVEAKEHVAGFMLIEARDRDAAVQIAAKSPVARIGTIEVRAATYSAPDEPGH
jgi:hypothetical protein